jgi:hypothetical protein
VPDGDHLGTVIFLQALSLLAVAVISSFYGGHHVTYIASASSGTLPRAVGEV